MSREVLATRTIPQHESIIHLGPVLSEKEYISAVGKKAVWAVNPELYRLNVKDSIKNKIRGILSGDYGEVEVPKNLIRILKEARLASPNGLTIDQLDDDGWSDLYRRNDDEIFRATSYGIHLPEGEGMTSDHSPQVEIAAAIVPEVGVDFKKWILKRLPPAEPLPSYF